MSKYFTLIINHPVFQIVGIVTLLSKTVTTRLFDTENQDYPNSLENFEDYEYNSDVGDGFGWLELEQKALYLSKQATYDDNEDYEKYESVRGTPMVNSFVKVNPWQALHFHF
jgi:hypothetical protein